ncbi:hypothetical protein [Agrobacterium vitis]|uniref:hypothetical protein n=1 Tax=Agrobacterium vitis TaxID=373 RepID=UPI003D2656B3
MTAVLTNTILSLYSQGLFQAALDEVEALPPGLVDDPRMAIIAGQCLYKLGHAEAAADHYVRAAERLGGKGRSCANWLTISIKTWETEKKPSPLPSISCRMTLAILKRPSCAATVFSNSQCWMS